MSRPGVVVLAGPPCSGKSSVGKALGSETRVHIELDSLFDLLRPGSDRGRADRMLAYDAAHLLASMLLDRGLTPVLECTYSRIEQRRSLINELASRPEVAVWIIEFTVSADDAIARFRTRMQETDLDERLLRERVESFPYFDGAHKIASETGSPTGLAGNIESWLAAKPPSVERERWVATGNDWT